MGTKALLVIQSQSMMLFQKKKGQDNTRDIGWWREIRKCQSKKAAGQNKMKKKWTFLVVEVFEWKII
jgi:hypothetical protein